jgi:hypothetical protein
MNVQLKIVVFIKEQFKIVVFMGEQPKINRLVNINNRSKYRF